MCRYIQIKGVVSRVYSQEKASKSSSLMAFKICNRSERKKVASMAQKAFSFENLFLPYCIALLPTGFLVFFFFKTFILLWI